MPLTSLLAFCALLCVPRGESWNPIELAGLRAREPVVAARPAPPAKLPQGALDVDGVPLKFPEAKQSWDLLARGQRFAIAPIEGGRYYDLVLACNFTGSEPAWLTLMAYGAGEVTRPALLECKPNADGADYSIVRLSVASPWPIESLSLPKDERLHVYAVSVRHLTEGPGNEKFRRAFLAAELPEKGMQRYLANLAEGGALRDKEFEAPYERMLFDHLLCGRKDAARRLVDMRLAPLEVKSVETRRDHLHVCLLVPPRGGSERLEELRTLIALLTEDKELAGAVSGMGLVRALEREAPEDFKRFATLVESGKLEIAGLQEELDWGTPACERVLRASFESGADYAEEHGWKKFARPGVLGDPALQPLLPNWCAARGLARVVQWSQGPSSPQVPAVFGWRTVDGAGVLVVHLPEPESDFAESALAPRIARSRSIFGSAEALVTIAVDASGDAARAAIAQLRALAAQELAPSLFFDTPASYVEELRKNERFKTGLWEARAGMDLGSAAPAPLALRSANRRAEVERECAARAGALAQLDGLVFLGSAQAELELALRTNFAARTPETLASSRAIAEQAHTRAQESLAVLAHSADTSGQGEALLVFNPLPFERSGLVELPCAGECVLDADGLVLPVQRTAEGKRLFLARVPALGHAVFHALAGSAQVNLSQAAQREGWRFTSSRLALRLDPETGALASLRLQPEGVELLGGAGDALSWLPRERATPGSWPAAPCGLELVEDGPLRLVLRRTREIAGARVVEDLILERDRPELVVRCRAEGLPEGGTLLASFTQRAAAKTLAFGSAGAEAHLDPSDRDPFALVPMRRFVHAGEGEFGLALLCADAARFGCGGNQLSIEIAGGGALAGGESCFALRPCLAEAGLSGLAEAADDLAYPLLCVRVDAHTGIRPARHAYLEFERRRQDGSIAGAAQSGIELVALRPCEDGLELELREHLGEGGELALSCARGLFGAQALDARGTGEHTLEFADSRIALPLQPWCRQRVRLRLRP